MHPWPESDNCSPRALPHDARTQHWEYPHSIPGSDHIQRFYYVLHALQRYQGNKVDSLGVPMFNVTIVFYTLCEDARQPSWVPGGAHIPRFYCVYTL
jgi:hypothetical protein